jgi:hypothetical protein
MCWSYPLHSSDTGEKWEYNETVYRLFLDFKKDYDSVRSESIRVPFKRVRLIKVYLKKTCSKVHVGKHLSYDFPIQNGLKHGDA